MSSIFNVNWAFLLLFLFRLYNFVKCNGHYQFHVHWAFLFTFLYSMNKFAKCNALYQFHGHSAFLLLFYLEWINVLCTKVTGWWVIEAWEYYRQWFKTDGIDQVLARIEILSNSKAENLIAVMDQRLQILFWLSLGLFFFDKKTQEQITVLWQETLHRDIYLLGGINDLFKVI